jgi:membrane-associated phospholipid phosphatase
VVQADKVHAEAAKALRDAGGVLFGGKIAAEGQVHAEETDALIVGVTLALTVKRWCFKVLWLLWPVWVWFSVMATANHFWLDVVAGIAVAGLAASILNAPRILRTVRA